MNGAEQVIERLDLVAGSVGISVLEGTGFSEKRLVAAFNGLLMGKGEAKDSVREISRRSAKFAEWADGCAGDLICRYSSKTSAAVHIIFPRALFNVLFERYLGGEGSASASNQLSKTQMRFAWRIANDMSTTIATGWPDAAVPSFRLIGASFDREDLSPLADGLLIIDLHLAAYTISIAFPAELVASMRSGNPAPPPISKTPPGEWRARLIERASEVRLPVRSVLARTEIPANRLLALKSGDVIPIAMPKTVPVTIGKHQFAHGTLGESHGCAAIRIETIGKGPTA